ncbi:hypothetical protein KBA63_00325 [Candidatus Woesebacteria bacterium]|nr:hypothetical protein [Candidatus Woesebacteria bacterium]MBP9687036.1 hypothetical protein [Candidatus Woesebacteria bacterium]
MVEQLLSLTGVIGIVSAISMIITPGFVSGVYKTDTPISEMNPDSVFSKVFILGLLVSGSSQALFALYLLNTYDLRSQKAGLGICVLAGVCCATLAIFRGDTHPYTHGYLAKGYFTLALLGGLLFQVTTAIHGKHDIIGFLLIGVNVIGILYIFVGRNSKFWAEVWGISLILAWYFHFYL